MVLMPSDLQPHRIFCTAFHPAREATTILQRRVPIRAPIAAANGAGIRIKGMGMTEQLDNAAMEREEITTRVANFKATQKRFQREREEYFVTTLENARNGSDGRPNWSW
jgi:chorismate mutase